MNPILAQLFELTARLKPAAGTTKEDLAELSTLIAGILVQQNLGAVPDLSDPSLDPEIVRSVQEGAALAASWQAAGRTTRFVRENHVNPAPLIERPFQVLGPFTDDRGTLVRFTVFQNAPFLAVNARLPLANIAGELFMLLPQGTADAGANRTFSIPAGTVWVGARFLSPGAQGYAGLRIAGGTLEVSSPGLRSGNRMLVFGAAQWTLTLQPEQPAAATPVGSDFHSMDLTIPQELVIRSAGAPTLTGGLSMAGFGSNLQFDTPTGAPIAGLTSIDLPFDPSGATWTIGANRSTTARVSGECRVASVAWSLPLNRNAVTSFGEAAHGGTLTARLLDGLDVALSGMTGGALHSFDGVLNANAAELRIEGRQMNGTGRVELQLWAPSITRCTFSEASITHLLFSSDSAGTDIAEVQGGVIRNRWDRPLSAAGTPFPYEGHLDQLAVFSDPTGLYVGCQAAQQPGREIFGVALENVYLTTRPPRLLAFWGSYDGASNVANGSGILLFNVLAAQPSLPHPYAANFQPQVEFQERELAFSLALAWANATDLTIFGSLESPVNFPTSLPNGLQDEDDTLRSLFDRHLHTQPELLSLLDLSSRDHHFGVALTSFFDAPPEIHDNRLSVRMREVRLLMQPQVQWEPVEVVPNPDANVNFPDTVRSFTAGARTLLGTSTVKLVPVLPSVISEEWLDAARQQQRAGALFSLPFGMRAFARLGVFEEGAPFAPGVRADLHEPSFGAALDGARQIRLIARGATDDRSMTGAMRQIRNLVGNLNNLNSVMGNVLETQLNEFQNFLPLHHADLSGYGLSTFSNWRRDVDVGITQVRFDVLNGRTSLEVVQTRSVLACCLAVVVRTIILERRNSGKVLRFDSGWQPASDGEFQRFTISFEKGVVIAFRNIRRIRILNTPLLTLADNSVWQPVLYDCDAELQNLTAGGSGGRVVVRGHAGYIQIAPFGPGTAPTPARMTHLFAKVGSPIGGPLDCTVRVGGTLEMQTSGIFAGAAPDDANASVGFVVAAFGSPKLPRAGSWSAVRIDRVSGEAAPVDPRNGMPVVRLGAQPFLFRDPVDARKNNPAAEYGFLMATSSSRVLFPRPTVNPGEAGTMRASAASVADPLSLGQSTGVFPRPAFTMRCKEAPVFDISNADKWRVTNPSFTIDAPTPELAKGGEWAIKREIPNPAGGGLPGLTALVDSANEAVPWNVSVDSPNHINIDVDPFGTLFTITTNYAAPAGVPGALKAPSLDFGQKLDDLKEIVNSLSQFVDLGFDIDVDVATGTGPSPSFIVRITLKFRIGKIDERIDIGIGKFYGEFTIRGELEAALSGKTHGRMLTEFQGDVQVGILPPLLFAGGLFRFALEIRETGRPLIEFAVGVTASIGGDLIKGLVEAEITVMYAYSLIPETLQPGVLLGIAARAKVLGGLVGFSFALQVMARIQRVSSSGVTIHAQVRVVASIQIAWLIEIDIDFETQFEQTLPLELAAIFVPALLPVVAAARL